MNRNHIGLLTAALAGLIFGLGLIISGMANPARVLAFLDVTGAWDPTLLCVMGGAVLVAAPAFALAARRGRSFTGAPLRLPAKTPINGPIVIGGAVFGMGWGLAGFCPGPAFIGIGAGSAKAMIFVAAMLAGMAIAQRYIRPPSR
jgi:uncharacterized membrane protein YedE/YeeE